MLKRKTWGVKGNLTNFERFLDTLQLNEINDELTLEFRPKRELVIFDLGGWIEYGGTIEFCIIAYQWIEVANIVQKKEMWKRYLMVKVSVTLVVAIMFLIQVLRVLIKI